MAYHPRIETDQYATLATVRARNSELWLVNNRRLEEAILGYLAAFTKRYQTKLYAFAIEGNHTHNLSLYPLCNRAAFQRDLNSCMTRAVKRYVPTYPGGSLWARRYSGEFVPGPEDIEEEFFYVVLQPVKDGLVDRISDYPGYNCFHDAVNGIVRKYKVVNWTKYEEAKRWHERVNIKDFTEIVELKYERIPGYEDLSWKEYRELMLKKLEERRLEIISKREGKPCMGRTALLATRPGAVPHSTKTSTRTSHRPRVLSVIDERRARVRSWYFSIYWRYKDASKRYRAGEVDVEFPEGTYRPYFYNPTSGPPPEC